MTSAKDLRVAPIASDVARAFVKKHHYSGKVANNSSLHFGVFLRSRLHGVMQFGPPIDKSKLIGLVEGTKWGDMLELNRMAFDDDLPRNSESRAISIAMRLIRKHYPTIEWVVSFADGTQCGDGTIYRASGFVLTSVKINRELLRLPDGSVIAQKTLNNPNHMGADGRLGSTHAREAGAAPLAGFQLRYIYFLNPLARARLTCPVLPFSEIDRLGARMYKGKRGGNDSPGGTTTGEGGLTPTSPLHQAQAASMTGRKAVKL